MMTMTKRAAVLAMAVAACDAFSVRDPAEACSQGCAAICPCGQLLCARAVDSTPEHTGWGGSFSVRRAQASAKGERGGTGIGRGTGASRRYGCEKGAIEAIDAQLGRRGVSVRTAAAAPYERRVLSERVHWARCAQSLWAGHRVFWHRCRCDTAARRVCVLGSLHRRWGFARPPCRPASAPRAPPRCRSCVCRVVPGAENRRRPRRPWSFFRSGVSRAPCPVLPLSRATHAPH